MGQQEYPSGAREMVGEMMGSQLKIRRSAKPEERMKTRFEPWSPALAMADSQDLRQLGSGAAWNRFVGGKTRHAQWMSFGIGIWFGPGETVVVSLMRNQTLMARRLGLASTLPGCGNWLRDQIFISQVCVKGGLWCTFVGGPDALIDWIRGKRDWIIKHKTGGHLIHLILVGLWMCQDAV